jgi:hypothetical protein
MSQRWEFPSPLSSGIELSPQHTVYETPPSQPVTPASFQASGDLPNLFFGDATATSETEPAKYPQSERLSSAELPFLTFDDYLAQLPYLGSLDLQFPLAPPDEHVLQQSVEVSAPCITHGHTIFSESAVAQLLDQEFPLAPSNQQILQQPIQVPADYDTLGHAVFPEPGIEHLYLENVVSGPSRTFLFAGH